MQKKVAVVVGRRSGVDRLRRVQAGGPVIRAAMFVALAGCGGAAGGIDAGNDASDDAVITIIVDAPDASGSADVLELDAVASDDAARAPDATFDASSDAWERRPIDCDLVARSGCTEPEACYPAGGMGSQCVRPTAASAATGASCEFGNDCQVGNACTRDLVCELLCDLAGIAVSCPSGPCRTVVELDLPPGVGTCP